MKPAHATVPDFIKVLLRPGAWDHLVSAVELVETHISWVLLTGDYAYKIKKPVDFGFLDFSSPEKRLHYCREEVRLNRRLAPEIYLDVVSICGSPDQPVVAGDGAAFEYAVRMHQFDMRCGFDRLLESGRLTREHMDKMAKVLADFQESTKVATAGALHGSPLAVLEPIQENFFQIRESLRDMDCAGKMLPPVENLERWSLEKFRRLEPVIAGRRALGFVREGHGDLHLRNIIEWNGRVIAFDCIEFNPNLRWIDVISELSFLLMDLDDHDSPQLSRRLLNAWLEYTGDYSALQLMRFYQVYRAMVRAKVASLRLLQSTESRETETRDLSNYIALAESYTRPTQPALLITHGLSGSGKTWFSQQLLEAAPVIRLRSDVERKRLHGVERPDRAGDETEGLYGPAATERTYGYLHDIARQLLGWGYTVIVDAAFLKRWQREMFADLSRQRRVPFAIVHCEAGEETSRQRLQRRQSAGSDASDADIAVFERQQEVLEPLAGPELEMRLRAELPVLLEFLAPEP